MPHLLPGWPAREPFGSICICAERLRRPVTGMKWGACLRASTAAPGTAMADRLPFIIVPTY